VTLALADLQAAGGVVWWLLELEVAGCTLRFTDCPNDVETVDGDGRIVVWLPGLADLVVQLDGESVEASISIEADIDIAQLETRAHDLHGTATLTRWAVDQPLSRGRTVVEGFVVAPGWGGPGEELTFSIARPAWTQAVAVPATGTAIGPDTWPSTSGATDDSGGQGRFPPLIIGQPSRALPSGRFAGGSPAPVARVGTTAADIRSSVVLAAEGDVVATEATLLWAGESGDVWDVVSLVGTMDGLGNRVTRVDLGDVENVLPESGGDYRIHWHAGGGVRSPLDPTRALQGAGEVIEYLLERAGLRCDRARQRAADLDGYRIDAAISAQVSVEQWIGDHLATTIGLHRNEGPDGIWYQAWSLPGEVSVPTAGVLLVEDGLEADGGVVVQRTGQVRASSLADVANRITVEYAFADDRPTRRVVVAGTSTGGALVSRTAAWSHARYGERAMRLQLAAVYDDGTATRIALRAAAARSLPRVSFQVEGEIELEALLRVGDVVSYSSTALGWMNRLALVRSVEIGRQTVAAQLELLEDPSLTSGRNP
jgi:hypothetical protein